MSSPYKTFVMDHAQHPRHSALLQSPTLANDTTDSVCGDSVSVTLKIEKDVITDVGIAVDGCALSTAGGSVLAEWLIGKRVLDAKSVDHQLIQSLLHIENPLPTRVRCMLLAKEALQQALS